MLTTEAEGMTGKLGDLSPWLDFGKGAWASPAGEGARGWEELPYWLKGYGDLGYVLGDERSSRKHASGLTGCCPRSGKTGGLDRGHC